MNLEMIPRKEILFLTHKKNLLKAFKILVEEYNQGKSIQDYLSFRFNIR